MRDLLKRPEQIAPGVYDVTWYRRWGRRYRSYLFVDGVPTLVDTCYDGAEFTEALVDGVDAVGVTPERLIITHGDVDHIGGLNTVADHYGLEVWVPAETEGVENDLSACERFSDGDQVGQFVAVHLPGHAPDNYALVDEEAGVAVLGDAAVGADLRGLPAGYLMLHAEAVTDDVRLAERSLERLLPYDFEVGLVFHGSSVTEGASEKLERFVNGPKKDR